MESLKLVVESIDVEWSEEFNDSSLIGDEVGMDSQEIVELVCKLEEKYNVNIEDSYIVRTDSLANIVSKMRELLGKDKVERGETHGIGVSSPYTFSRKDSIHINTSVDSMMSSLWNLHSWEKNYHISKKLKFYMTMVITKNF